MRPVLETTPQRADPHPTIADVEETVRTLLRNFPTRDASPAMDLALRHIERFFDNGGKRIRSRMVLAGRLAADAACAPEQAICTAAAFEIVHNGILVQDDILDRSDMRRGAPTVRAALVNEGYSPVTADDIAMMIGWLGQTLGLRLIVQARMTEQQVQAVLPTLCDYQERCAAGQILDTVGADTVEGAREIARWKNYYTFAPLLAGAALCDPAPELVGALRRFAEPMVEATQYRNDIVGVFEESENGVSADLREGQTTVLALETLRLADPRTREVFAGFLGNADLTAEDTALAQEIITSSGALRAVLDRIQGLTDEAVGALDSILIPAAALRELEVWVTWSRTGRIGST